MGQQLVNGIFAGIMLDLVAFRPPRRRADSYCSGLTSSLPLTSHSYVLQTGRIVLDGSSEDLLKDEAIVAAYLGTSRIERPMPNPRA
jgi:hypothetical protein